MRAILVATLLVGSVAAADPNPEPTPEPTIGSETIEIHDHVAPAVVAKPQHYFRKRVPAYSSKAILSDAWTSAWMLLDIDPKGYVQRIKFLTTPGYDLEPIAEKEMFGMQFDPARDAHNNPMPSRVVWRMEWPSHGWLEYVNDGLALSVPDVGFPARPATDFVPCANAGVPWKFESGYPAYRDCRVPDFKKAIDHAAWVYRARH